MQIDYKELLVFWILQSLLCSIITMSIAEYFRSIQGKKAYSKIIYIYHYTTWLLLPIDIPYLFICTFFVIRHKAKRAALLIEIKAYLNHLLGDWKDYL